MHMCKFQIKYVQEVKRANTTVEESIAMHNKNMERTQYIDYEQNTKKTGKLTINEVKTVADNIKQATWQKAFKHVPESTLSFSLPSPPA